jgi:nitrogen regulatory protein PII
VKRVVALIQPERLERVAEVLNEEGFHLVTVTDVMG